MPQLRFLHLNRPLPSHMIIAEQIVRRCAGPLEVLGLGETFWRIVRNGPDVMINTKTMEQRWFLLDLTIDTQESEECWLLGWHEN